VRLAALNLKDLRGGSGWSRSGSVISENLEFHLNSRVSNFSLNVTFLRKLGHLAI